jgi:hypothetical protein
MTLFVVAFFVIAAVVLVSWLMVRPLTGELPSSERKRRSPSSAQRIALPAAPASRLL